MGKVIKKKLHVYLMLCLTFCMIFNSSVSSLVTNVSAVSPENAIERSVSSETEFKQAIIDNNNLNQTEWFGKTKIVLTQNILITSDDNLEDIKKDLVVDLNGYSITVTYQDNNPLFEVVDGAILTLMDRNPNAETSITYDITKVNAVGEPVDASGNVQNLKDEKGYTTNIQATPITEKVKGGYITGHKKSLINVNNSTFVMNGGCLYNNGVEASGTDGGAIYAHNASTIKLNNGYIIGNKGSWGGAVYANSNTLVTIGDNDTSNGEMIISGNTALYRGGFIHAVSGTDITMNSGYVTNNNANSGDNRSYDTTNGGGGFFLDGSGTTFTMHGGYITGNESQTGGGGGIRAGFYTYNQDLVHINIYGGYICSNISESEGAGLSVGASCHAYIAATGNNSIYFTNNITSPTEHWGGGGIFCADGGSITIMDALVTENTSLGYGGGVAGCSTGRVFDNAEHNAAIFDNISLATAESVAQGIGLSGTSSSKSADHTYTVGNRIFLANGYNDYFSALNSVIGNSMLGGGIQGWVGTCDNSKVFLVGAPADRELQSTFLMGLTAQTTNEDEAKAKAVAKVFIQDNYSATHGGGILCNGYVFFGNVPETAEIWDRLSISATKTVSNAQHINGVFEFELLNENFEVVSTTESTHYDGDAENEGYINALIPFMIAQDDTPTNVENIYSYTYYFREKAGTGSYSYDDTVYRIILFGTKTTEKTSTLNNQGSLDEVEVTTHKITDVTVSKGTIENNEAGNPTYTVNGSLSKDTHYSLNLSTGSNNAKTLSFIGTTFTNEYETTSVNVKKVWNDNNNSEGLRPTSITVELYFGDTVVDTKELSNDNNWYYEWTNLDLQKNGQNIEYSVRETNVSDLYKVETTNTGNSWTITNSRNVEYVNVNGQKTWDDKDDQDGKRPESITVRLLANGEQVDFDTITAVDNWAYTFNNLPKYKDGNIVTYTIIEDAVEGYTTTINGYNITNSYTPENIEVSGVKTWNDNNNQDGKRPESITVRLLADGEQVGSKTVKATDNWTYIFENLPKYEDGKVITYTITEDTVTGYTTEINGYNITNSHTPETIEISGTKTWDDNNDQDGKRPNSITINLLADGEQVNSKTVTAADNWTYIFSNLPKYEDGKEIVYTISEDAIADYTTVIDGFDVKNTHEPATVNVIGTKTWDPGNYSENAINYPNSVTVNLHKNGVIVDTQVVNESTNWKYSFTGLPKYEEGALINWGVTEVPIEGFTPTITDNIDESTTISPDYQYDIKNTYTPDYIEFPVSKSWDDEDNQDGMRPESITIRLYANGEKTEKTITINSDTNWFGRFTNLEKTDGTNFIVYTVKEENIANDYNVTINGNHNTGYVITNQYTPKTISISGEKTWVDENNQDGLRPESIIVNLLANGIKVETKTVKAVNGNWAYSFTNLPKYEKGQEITYSISEEPVEGYTTEINGYNITNSHTPETIEISGIKTWNDNNNQDGKRPESITVKLMNGNTTVQTKQVTAADDWKYTFSDLPKYANGTEIVYTVSEEDVDGYELKVSGYNITNTHEPETISISGTKTWDDNNNQDGIRPDTITVHLIANGKHVKKASFSGTTYTFTNLPKYADGKEIVYTVEEDSVDGYTTSIEGLNITNTHEPETISIFGTKIWDDNNNQDGIRPTSITVNLLENNEKIKTQVITADDNGNWSYKFDDLPKYKIGKEIAYTITEDKIEDYTASISVDDQGGYVITNSHTPEIISIPVSKIWDDANDHDNKRPGHITVRLLADGVEVKEANISIGENGNWSYKFDNLPKYKNGKEIEYTITEDKIEDYTTSISGNVENGYVITNSHTPEKISISGTKTWNHISNKNDVNPEENRPTSILVFLHRNGEVIAEQIVTADENGNWSYTFENLNKYHLGHLAQYSISEAPVKDYSTIITGYDITNQYNPGYTSLTVSKEWLDMGNQDGKRPESVTVMLLANGEDTNKTLVLNEANDWTDVFNDIPLVDGMTYSVREIMDSESSEIYDSEVIKDELSGEYIIINSYTPETISISGTKTWNDNDNQDGKRPESITVNLLANGNEIKSQVIRDDGNGNWNYTFSNLPKYEDGVEIAYTISEDLVNGYTTEYDHFNIINTHIPETTSVHVTKVWDDNDDQDGIRPDSITVHLHVNGKHLDKKVVTATDDWSCSWEELPKYQDGVLQIYTIAEDSIKGYINDVETSNLEDAPNFDIIAEENFEFEVTLTNVHTPETTNIEIKKVWDDAYNQDGIRPNSITVYLKADDEIINTYVLSEENSWSVAVSDLPKFNNGTKIKYMVKEEEVNGYSYSVDSSIIYTESISIPGIISQFVELEETLQNVITNKHTPELTSVSGIKTWLDNDNAENNRPSSIVVRLYDGVIERDFQIVTPDENGNWSYKFDNLPKYRHGEEIKYNVIEDVITDYTVTYVKDSYDIINTYNPGKTTVTVTKLWSDDNNRDGLRPEEITIRLYADGTEIDEMTLSEKENWTGTFIDLPMADENGKTIVYTVSEDVVEGYDTVISGTAKEGYVITNIHDIETTEVKVSKVWDDGNNKDHLRPTSITVNLLANNTIVETIKITAEDKWSHTFLNLPKYEDGKKIEYTVSEEVVDDYETIIEKSKDGYVITNKHEPNDLTTTTGDDNNIALYAGVLGVSAIGLGVFAVSKKKKKEEDE